MRLQFNPFRFLGHVLFAYIGAAFAGALTFLIVRYVAPGTDAPSSGSPVILLFSGMVLILPLILPVIVLLILSGYLVPILLPSVEPGSVRMTFVLGIGGILLAVGVILLIGIGDRGDFGKHALLAASVAGGLAGIIIARRMTK